jgi:hypothetical protein
MQLEFGDRDPTAASGFVDAEGRCHLKVESIDETKKPTVATCVVIAHDVPGQVGKTISLRLNSKGDFVAQTRDFCVATDIYSMDRFVEGKKDGRSSFSINMQAAVGKTFLSKVVKSKDGKYYNLRTFLRPDDVSAKSEEWPVVTVEDPGEIEFKV